jgi:hypothetical protein
MKKNIGLHGPASTPTCWIGCMGLVAIFVGFFVFGYLGFFFNLIIWFLLFSFGLLMNIFLYFLLYNKIKKLIQPNKLQDEHALFIFYF